jgi:RNA polymerase sigma-70 factor (ECF subfamily)
MSGTEWGPYAIQAAIAAEHAAAKRPATTDWERIVRLYDILLRLEPSPVIELNRAVAVAMRDGPAAGLVLIDALMASGTLGEYHLAHSARGELQRQLGSKEEARASFRRALDMVRQGPEKRLLERRLEELA